MGLNASVNVDPPAPALAIGLPPAAPTRRRGTAAWTVTVQVAAVYMRQGAAQPSQYQTKGVFFQQSQQLAEMVHGHRMFQIRSRRANSTIRTRQQLQAIQLGVDPAECLAVPPGAVGTPAFQATLRRIAQRLIVHR